MQRRDFLSSAIALAAASTLPAARAEEITGGQLWEPGTASLPALPTVRQGGPAFFNQHEFQTAEAIAERLIPTDALSIGGKEAGCATFIDRQLAGDYGKGATLYRLGRFVKGTFEHRRSRLVLPCLYSGHTAAQEAAVWSVRRRRLPGRCRRVADEMVYESPYFSCDIPPWGIHKLHRSDIRLGQIPLG